MFGKTVLRLISYAVAGAVAILLGGRIVSSVASVVFAWRMGNPLPIIVVIVGSLVLVLFSRGEANTLPKMIMNILGWIAAAYLSVVIFFVSIPLGLIAGFFGLALTLMSFGAIKDTKGIGGRLRFLVYQIVSAGSAFPALRRNSAMNNQSIWFLVRGLALRSYLVPRGQRFRILDLVRERPLLPVSLTRYGNADILFVRENPQITDQIESLLEDEGIQDALPLGPFLTNALLALPLIEERDACFSPADYVFCRDESTVNRLVDIWPDRITVFPSMGGPIVVVRNDTVPGFETRPLPRGTESCVLLERDVSMLATGGTEVVTEHSA